MALLLPLLTCLPAQAGGADSFDSRTQHYIDGLVSSLEARSAKPQPITLSEAVLAAVANNPGIAAKARVPQAEREGVFTAAAAYEPKVSVELGYSDRKIPTTNSLDGVNGRRSGVRKDDEYIANLGISKLLRSGTSVDLAWNNQRRTTNSDFEDAVPRFDPTLGITVSQPLLRDFGGFSARTAVSLARNQSGRSAAEYEASLSSFVASVVDQYWAYTLAEAELEVARRSLRLANELAEAARKRVAIGTVPPVAAQEAHADAAAREEEMIAAENTLDSARRTLQYTIMAGAVGGAVGGATSGAAPLAIKPSDRHQVAEIDTARGQRLLTAIEKRAEIREARLAVDNAKIAKRLSRNRLLPSLDLVGNYDLVGLGGKRNTDPAPSVVINENLNSRPSQLADSESGAYGDALDSLLSGDFFRYRVRLQLEVPLFNADAKSRYARSTIELSRVEETLRQTVADVALEIDKAAGEVEAAEKRVFAARLARELAEENLHDQSRRYDVGLVTTTDVLTFQKKLTSAMATEARAITDHANAVTALRRAEGTLLESYGISVEFEDSPGLPWWAKF